MPRSAALPTAPRSDSLTRRDFPTAEGDSRKGLKRRSKRHVVAAKSKPEPVNNSAHMKPLNRTSIRDWGTRYRNQLTLFAVV